MGALAVLPPVAPQLVVTLSDELPWPQGRTWTETDYTIRDV
jgi:hypothetical protein